MWRYFQELCFGLASSGWAPPVLTWEGLLAWCQVRRVTLTPWESRALVQLARARAEILTEKKPGEH